MVNSAVPELDSTDLPGLVAGPVLRRTTAQKVVIWFVTAHPLSDSDQITFYLEGSSIHQQSLVESCQTVTVGRNAHIHLLQCEPEHDFPLNSYIEYDLFLHQQALSEALPYLCYPGRSRPGFVIKQHLDQVLHGSCRKPHYPSDDALLRVDQQLERSCDIPGSRAALLMMSGDQIYADDVAGPMLSAIHQVINLLGLTGEKIEGAAISSAEELYSNTSTYYQREQLLPKSKAGRALKDLFFSGVQKPIFTADTAHNHLITLSEVIAMYLLVWSPQLWKFIKLNINDVDEVYRDLYLQEQRQIEHFVEGLPRVQRALAQIPVYMIFDDHDVTDDWNLTAGWEQVAYSHSFSKRILGNALIGYLLCQGWGNDPQKFESGLISRVQDSICDCSSREELIDNLLKFEQWHYSLQTQPKLLVLDTRTRRWWSESNLAKPSGLMDWEALSELQQELIDEPSVILVSPAPIFGMKLIETVQRIFTYFGQALMVDAENWMAHAGSANVILNIFRHVKTPQNFIILSGDVHYSFAYDVKIRFRKNSPDIWQITCSGLKNEFPHRLLALFDRVNRWLFGSKSPLNWLTKRRRMQVKARIPHTDQESRVVNQSAVGFIEINSQGEPVEIGVLPADGSEKIIFPARDDLK